MPPATAPEPLLPVPLPETRQQMEVQQGNCNCNHSLNREKNECCLAVKRMPLAASSWGKVIAALSYRKKRMQQRAGRKAADA